MEFATEGDTLQASLSYFSIISFKNTSFDWL